jgi:ABC-type branched-subunit amino acid transport system substrate-binding protein
MHKLLLFLSIALVSISTAQSEDSTTPTSKLRIGVIAPLTGGIASWGLSVRSAIELANSESEHPADLFFEDEETCVPTKALTALKYLQSVKKIDVLVTSCLGGAQAIGPLARQSKLPLYVSGRSSHDFQNKNPNALSWLSLLDYEGKAVVQLIKDKSWKKGTAMVWSEYFGVQFAVGIQSALKDSKLNFFYDVIEVDPGSNPVGAEVQKLVRGNPEVVFLMLSEAAATLVIKQLKSQRYSGAIVLQSSMLQTYDPNVRSVFQGALQQKFQVNESEFKRLQSLIKLKQGQEVADDFVFSYDGFKALLNEAAVCRVQQPLSLEVCLTDRLRNETWREGASGPFRFMKDGSTERPMVFKTISVQGFL